MIDRLYNVRHAHTPARIDRLPERLRGSFDRAAVTEEHVEGLTVWLAAGPVVAVVAWIFIGPIPAWCCVGVVIGTPLVVLVRWSGRQEQQMIQALPDAVEATSRALRSGASFSLALSETVAQAPAAFATELTPVLATIEAGMPSEQALQEWADRMPCPEVEMVAATFALAHQFEAGATQALDGVGQSLRDRSALHDEVQALTAQASMSVRAMVLLQVAFLLLDAVTDRSTMEFLLTERFGRACLATGIILNLLGWWWMTVTTRRRLSSCL